MIKRFCDSCGDEITSRNTIKGGISGDRLEAEVKNGNARLKVEVITSKDGTANDGDFCKYCVLDAIARLDDRDRCV